MNINTLKSVIDQSIESKNEVGVSAIVTNGDSTVFSYSSGLADIDNDMRSRRTYVHNHLSPTLRCRNNAAFQRLCKCSICKYIMLL